MRTSAWVLVICATVSCRDKRTFREFGQAEVVGSYVLHWGAEEGLVVEPAGSYEHCWRTATGDLRRERGRWRLSSGPWGSEVLAEGITDTATHQGAAPVNMLLAVSEYGGDLTLNVDFDVGVYFVKQVGSNVCNRQ